MKVMEEDIVVDMHEKVQEFHPDVYQVKMMLYTIDEFHSSFSSFLFFSKPNFKRNECLDK
jgi:hypothetical protein